VRPLLPLVLAAALAACSSLPPTITPAPSTGSNLAPTIDPSLPKLTVDVANTQLSLGEERIAFHLHGPSGELLTGDGIEATVKILAVRADGSEASVASGPALYFGSAMPGGGAWVTYSTFDSSGRWVLQVTASKPDGWQAVGRANLDVQGRTALPRVGSRPPATENPTIAGDDASAVTSDPQPDPELYRMTVAQALDSGRPTVVFLGSPAHCDTDACSATLREIKATRAKYASRVNFIHIETRDLADPASVSPAAEEWHLPSEPWTFILDKSGLVANRIEGPIDQVELGLLLDRTLSGARAGTP
jgi:hypothetical protein